MSTSESINLAGDVPNEAIDVYESKPDVRQAYSTVDASDYDGRSGDLSTLIEDAASQNAIVDLGSGTYEMSSTVSVSSGTVGFVGDGSDSCTIHHTGTSLEYLFVIDDASNIILEGSTIDIRENNSTDVGVGKFDYTNEMWAEDVVFRGQRDISLTDGGIYTFLVRARDSSARGLINQCDFPDGGTNHSSINTSSHEIGPNSDPTHAGLNVWRQCYAAGFMNNGFYVSNTPEGGRNVLWNCTARNNASGGMRVGENDVIVGGLTEVTDLPDDRLGQPLVVDTGGNINIVGLQVYGSGDSYGSEGIAIRQEAGNITLDRVSLQVTGSRRATRFDANNTVTIDGGWYLDEGSSGQEAIYIPSSTVQMTSDTNVSEAAVHVGDGASFTLDGEPYGTGEYTASELGLGSPTPLPTYNFDGVQSGGGTDYPSSGGGSGGGGTGGGGSGGGTGGSGGGTTTPQQIDGSDSPGSRWGLTQERTAMVENVPEGPIRVVVEPQWFNTGTTAGGGTGGTGGGTGDSSVDIEAVLNSASQIFVRSTDPSEDFDVAADDLWLDTSNIDSGSDS